MPSMKGFMGKSGGGGAVTAAAVLAALVGGAIAAATLTLTGDIQLAESTAPSCPADTSCIWSDSTTGALSVSHGAGGEVIRLIDDGGNMSLDTGKYIAWDGWGGLMRAFLSSGHLIFRGESTSAFQINSTGFIQLLSEMDTAGQRIRYGEMAAPSGSANDCQIYTTDESTVSTMWTQCGASGTPTQLADENGDASFANDVAVANDIVLDAASKVCWDAACTSDYIDNTGGALRVTANGTNTIDIDNLSKVTMNTETAFLSYVSINGPLKLFNIGGTDVSQASFGGYTMSDTGSDPVLMIDASGGAGTVTLPSAQRAFFYILKDDGSAAGNDITIAPDTSDAIPECPTSLKITSNYGWVQLWAHGTTNWYIVGGSGYTCT